MGTVCPIHVTSHKITLRHVKGDFPKKILKINILTIFNTPHAAVANLYSDFFINKINVVLTIA